MLKITSWLQILNKQKEKPTFQKVALWTHELLNFCALDEEDDSGLRVLKDRAIDKINEKIKIDVFHQIALFLDPRHRTLQILSASEKKIVKQEVQNWLKKLGIFL